MNPKICSLTCTKNRHTAIERNVRFFLDQTYANSIQLIYNNSSENLILDSGVNPEKVILINNSIDLETGNKYTNLGDIYRDAITFIPKDVEVINFMDDDDIFLPDHIEEGIKGLLRGGKKAYKPKKSYFRTSSRISLVENTLEPSIFVLFSHILEHGFSKETTAQHLKWVNPLVYDREIYVDIEGKSTMAYNWGDSFHTWKTSGDPNNPENFNNYERNSKDIGDGVITPFPRQEVENLYNLFI